MTAPNRENLKNQSPYRPASTVLTVRPVAGPDSTDTAGYVACLMACGGAIRVERVFFAQRPPLQWVRGMCNRLGWNYPRLIEPNQTKTEERT